MELAPPTAEPVVKPRATLADAVGIGVVASVAIIVLSVVQAKISAVLLGPRGVGSLAEVRQVVATVLVPLSALVGASLVSAFGEAHGRGDMGAVQRIYDVASSALAVSALAFGIVTVSIAITIVPSDWGAHRVAAVGLATLAVVGTTWLSLVSILLLATGELRESLRVTVLAAVANLIGACVGTVAFGLFGQLVGLALAPWLVWPLALRMASRRHPTMRMIPRPSFHRDVLRRIVLVGLSSICAGFALQGALSVIRWSLHHHEGVAANGQFQAAWSIGVGYLALILNSVGNVVFPRYAAARSPDEIQTELENASSYVMTFAPPVILIAISVRQPAMKILFTGDFALAAQVLGLQMAGDLAKALAYVQAGPLLYRNHLRSFLVTELVASALLAGGAFFGIPRFGLIATGYSYVLAYVVYLAITTWFVESTCRVRTDRRRQLVAVGFCLVGATLVIVTSRWPWANVLVGLAGVAWAFHGGVPQQLLHRVLRKRATHA